MSYPAPVWEQIKNTSARRLARALERAGFVLRHTRGSHRVYYYPSSGRRVVFQYHSGSATFKTGTLKGILASAGWTVDDLVEVGLVRKAV